MAEAARVAQLGENVFRIEWTGGDGALTVGDIYRRLAADADFAIVFSQTLASLPFTALCWETPALTAGRLDAPFECVAVASPMLAHQKADARPFAEPFSEGADARVVSFDNLGGDARLVAPCPTDAAADYCHLASFLRTAPEGQVAELWRAVAEAVQRRLSEREVFWVSTAGLGVSWLHVRLDDRPKYYRHGPYRTAAP